MSVAAWICPTCGQSVGTPYCPRCGEKPLRPRDLTLGGLLEQAFQALSSVDSTLIRSFRVLLTRPGELTANYVSGRRAAWLGPVHVFIIANVLLFAAQSLTQSTVVGVPLASNLTQQDWSELARSLVNDRLAAKQTMLEAYAPIFDHAAVLNAKTLIVLMGVPFTLLLPLMFPRSGQPFVAHVVFALHFYTFVLLLLCAALVAGAVERMLGGEGIASPVVDLVLSACITLGFASYLWFATGTVYGARGVARAAKVAVLAVAVGAIVVGYRFVIFLFTLYTT